MAIIDANTLLGRSQGHVREQPLAVLPREMAGYGVAMSAACSLRGVLYDHTARVAIGRRSWRGKLARTTRARPWPNRRGPDGSLDSATQGRWDSWQGS